MIPCLGMFPVSKMRLARHSVKHCLAVRCWMPHRSRACWNHPSQWLRWGRVKVCQSLSARGSSSLFYSMRSHDQNVCWSGRSNFRFGYQGSCHYYWVLILDDWWLIDWLIDWLIIIIIIRIIFVIIIITIIILTMRLTFNISIPLPCLSFSGQLLTPGRERRAKFPLLRPLLRPLRPPQPHLRPRNQHLIREKEKKKWGMNLLVIFPWLLSQIFCNSTKKKESK